MLWYAILLALVFAVVVGAGALAYFYKGRYVKEKPSEPKVSEIKLDIFKGLPLRSGAA